MLHFSCDLCGRQLDEQRYVVRMEAFPAFDPDQVTEADLDADHLQEVAETLEKTPADATLVSQDGGAKVLRFDLCPYCYRRFLRDPLGRDAFRQLNFSKN